MYSRAGISRQVAAPTKTETNLAVRSQADMDVVVAAEAEVTMVDTSTWNQCSQERDNAVGQVAIRTQTLSNTQQLKVLSQVQMRIRCWS